MRIKVFKYTKKCKYALFYLAHKAINDTQDYKKY